MKKYIIISLLALLFMQGQTQETTHVIGLKRPELNGHIFPAMAFMQPSFINTKLSANIGVGSTGILKIPGIIIDDHEILSFEGRIIFMQTDVSYQQRFNSWLAMYVSYTLAARIGSDVSTILADGVNTISGNEIGWKLKIRETDQLNVSGTVSLFNMTGNFMNVADYFRDLINDDPLASVTKKIPALAVGGGLQAAYAFNSKYGLQFNGRYFYGESFTRGSNQGFYSIGLSGDVDFYPQNRVPLGLALGYSLSSSPEVVMGEGGNSNLLIGSLSYTGSREFELGLQFNYYNMELPSIDNKPYLSKIMLLLNFYF